MWYTKKSMALCKLSVKQAIWQCFAVDLNTCTPFYPKKNIRKPSFGHIVFARFKLEQLESPKFNDKDMYSINGNCIDQNQINDFKITHTAFNMFKIWQSENN